MQQRRWQPAESVALAWVNGVLFCAAWVMLRQAGARIALGVLVVVAFGVLVWLMRRAGGGRAVLVIGVVGLTLALGGRVALGADTTPPVLDAFTVTPTVIDTSSGAVTVDWCVTAHDASGFQQVLVSVTPPSPEPANVNPGVRTDPGCGTITFPATSVPGESRLCVDLVDAVGNPATWCEPTVHPGHPEIADLCPLGPCRITNTAGSSTTTTTTLVPQCARVGRDGAFNDGAYVRMRPHGCKPHELPVP